MVENDEAWVLGPCETHIYPLVSGAEPDPQIIQSIRSLCGDHGIDCSELTLQQMMQELAQRVFKESPDVQV